MENRLNIFANEMVTLASRADQAVRELQQQGQVQQEQDKALRTAIDEWTAKLLKYSEDTNRKVNDAIAS